MAGVGRGFVCPPGRARPRSPSAPPLPPPPTPAHSATITRFLMRGRSSVARQEPIVSEPLYRKRAGPSGLFVSKEAHSHSQSPPPPQVWRPLTSFSPFPVRERVGCVPARPCPGFAAWRVGFFPLDHSTGSPTTTQSAFRSCRSTLHGRSCSMALQLVVLHPFLPPPPPQSGRVMCEFTSLSPRKQQPL